MSLNRQATKVFLFALGMVLLCRGPLVSQTPPRAPFKVAAVQFNPKFKSLEPNVQRLAKAFEQAAKQGAKVIVAPEMATTGYLYSSREEIQEFVDTIPGETTKAFAEVSRKYKCYLAWGMAEVDAKTGLYYNSMALVGPEGYVGKYRKTHLWEAEAHWSAGGNLGIPVFKTPFGNLAMIVCQDANYMETFRLALLGGADIVCFATNSSGQTASRMQARAIQNGLFIISANRSNVEKDFRMRGCSAVWSPAGKKLAEASLTKEEILFGAVDPARYADKDRILRQRKPKRYLNLIRHIAPWNYARDIKVRRLQAVALQYEPVPGNLARNRAKVEALLKKHSWQINSFSLHRTLVVLPELSLTGRVPPDKIKTLAEPLDGKQVGYIKDLARRYQSYITFGMAEKAGEDEYYNAVVLVSPAGKVVGRVRKVHLNDYDRQWAQAGKRFSSFETEDLGRVGLLVGGDAYIPEAGALLAIQRCKVVAVPSSWHGEVAGDGQIRINPVINPHAKMGGMVLWDNMAWEFLYYTIVANYVGGEKKYGGRSGIYSVDPIYGHRSPGLAGHGQTEQAVVGVFNTRSQNHWITQQQYIASRRAAGDLYYPLIRRKK